MMGERRIPNRYKHTATQVSGVDATSKIRVRGSFLGEINPDQSNKISWFMPNRADLPFLDMSSVTMRGQVWVNCTSDNVLDTYATMQPSIGGTYTGMNLILNRITTLLGSTVLDDAINNKLLSSMDIGLQTNPIWELSMEPFQNAGKFVAGDIAPSWREFRIKLGYRNTDLYGSSSDATIDQHFLMPTGIAPRMEVDAFFSPANTIVSVVAAQVGATLTPEYKLRNLELDCLYLDSKVLRAKLRGPNPWSFTFTSHLFSDYNLQPGASGKISVQLPSSYQQLSHAMLNVQAVADDTDLLVPNRVINTSAALSQITECQIRVNGVNRFSESLTQSDLHGEIIRLHPSAEFSDFINVPLTQMYTTNNYILLLCGRDYPSPALISGINSSTQTGSVVVEITFTSALAAAHSVRSFLAYSRNVSIASNGNAVITF